MGVLQDSTYQYRMQVEHLGQWICLAANPVGQLFYAVQSSGGGWTSPAPLLFPSDADDASIAHESGAGTPIIYISDSSLHGANLPFRTASDGSFLFVFRVSRAGTILMDRFILDLDRRALVRPFDLRDPSTGHAMPESVSTRFSFRHRDGTNFFAPTTELSFVGNVGANGFSVSCRSSTGSYLTSWVLGTLSPTTHSLTLFTFRTTVDGRVDINDLIPAHLSVSGSSESCWSLHAGIACCRIALGGLLPERLSLLSTFSSPQGSPDRGGLSTAHAADALRHRVMVGIDSADGSVALVTLDADAVLGIRPPHERLHFSSLRLGRGCTHASPGAALRLRQFASLEDRTGEDALAATRAEALELRWSGIAYYASSQTLPLIPSQAYELGVEWTSDADANLSELLLVGWNEESGVPTPLLVLPGAVLRLPSGRRLVRVSFKAPATLRRCAALAFQAPAGRWNTLLIHQTWLRPLFGDVTRCESSLRLESNHMKVLPHVAPMVSCLSDSAATVATLSGGEHMLAAVPIGRELAVRFDAYSVDWQPGAAYRISLTLRADRVLESARIMLTLDGQNPVCEVAMKMEATHRGLWQLETDALIPPMQSDFTCRLMLMVSAQEPLGLLLSSAPTVSLIETNYINPQIWKTLLLWHPSARSDMVRFEGPGTALLPRTMHDIQWQECIVNTMIDVSEGQLWIQSVEYLSDGVADAPIISFYGPDGQAQTHHLFEPERLPLSDGWTLARATFAVPPGMMRMRVFNLFAPGGTWNNLRLRNPRCCKAPDAPTDIRTEANTVLKHHSGVFSDVVDLEELPPPERLFDYEWQRAGAVKLQHITASDVPLRLQSWGRTAIRLPLLAREAEGALRGVLIPKKLLGGSPAGMIRDGMDILMGAETVNGGWQTLLFESQHETLTASIQWRREEVLEGQPSPSSSRDV